jgi:hypothetical protein
VHGAWCWTASGVVADTLVVAAAGHTAEASRWHPPGSQVARPAELFLPFSTVVPSACLPDLSTAQSAPLPAAVLWFWPAGLLTGRSLARCSEVTIARATWHAAACFQSRSYNESGAGQHLATVMREIEYQPA